MGTNQFEMGSADNTDNREVAETQQSRQLLDDFDSRVDAIETMRDVEQLVMSIDQERRDLVEQKPQAELSVAIDHDVIRQQLEAAGSDAEKALWETFINLPERLEFNPGITLIVGENGSGKTTLGKAISLAMRIKEQTVRNIASLSSQLYRDEQRGGERTKEELVPKYKKDLKGSETKAENDVLNPKGDQRQLKWLAYAGLAPELARAIKVKKISSLNPDTHYIDVEDIITQGRVVDEEFINAVTIPDPRRGEKVPLMDSRQAAEELQKTQAGLGSRRQTIKAKLPNFVLGTDKRSDKKVFFIDEPEAGMSPMAHVGIIRELEELVDTSTSIACVPTNSTVLFLSNLPRIDLRYPKRGIFKPSDYPPEELQSLAA